MSPDFRSLALGFPEFSRGCRFISLKLWPRDLVKPSAASLTHSGYHFSANSCRGNKATNPRESSYLEIRHSVARGRSRLAVEELLVLLRIWP